MTRRRIDILITTEEHATLRRLGEFARKNNLELFNVRGSIYQRVQTITRNNGRCPCKQERKWCPCKECIQECKTKGECFCRVFIAKK